MIEFVFFIAILLFIGILFYKQANEEFQIIQLNADRIEELPTLYVDRSPIVVRDFQPPSLGSQEALEKRPQILQMAVAPQVTLQTLLASNSLATFQFPPAATVYLAKESGLHIWFEHHLYKKLLPSPWTSWLYSFQTSLWPHHRGMFKTTAIQTLLMPTQGSAVVSLLLPKMIPYLPTRWEGRPFKGLSQQDTPLLNQIQFIEIKLRKGTFLMLPAHVIVDISSVAGDTAWIFQADIHHPISRIAG